MNTGTSGTEDSPQELVKLITVDVMFVDEHRAVEREAKYRGVFIGEIRYPRCRCGTYNASDQRYTLVGAPSTSVWTGLM